MVCEGLTVMGTDLGWADYFVFPTTCFYWFYAVLLFGIWGSLTFILFNTEREKYVKADLISCMGVSATAVMFLTLIGTLVKSTSGIPMIQSDILLYVFAFWIVFVGIWFFKE